jgi:hypothetical protein
MSEIKKYSGNIPSEKEGWKFLEDYIDIDKVTWKMFYKHSDDKSYLNFKIVALEVANKKANYWISICLDSNEFCFKKDLEAMIEYRNDLFLFLLKTIEQF